MVLCSVLSVKPYSGYYQACVNCMGKVLQDQEERWWCRKCSCVVSCSNVRERYCVAMTITDHTTPPQDAVVFGKSCDDIFGCSAADLTEYLSMICLDSGTIHQLLYKALTAILVGRFYDFSLVIPSTKTSDILTLSSILELNRKLKGRRSDKGVELVAMGIKALGKDLNTVLRILQLHIEGNHTSTQATHTPQSVSTQHAILWTQDESRVVSNDSRGASPSQAPSLLLQTYTDSPQALEIGETKVTTDKTLATQSAICPKSEPQGKLEPSQNLEAIHQFHHSNVSADEQVNFFAEETISQYLSELTRNESLLRELESDWEATQQTQQCSQAATKNAPHLWQESLLTSKASPSSLSSTPCLPSKHCSRCHNFSLQDEGVHRNDSFTTNVQIKGKNEDVCFFTEGSCSLSEEMVQELQQPFSQSREASPLNAHRHDVLTPGFTESQYSNRSHLQESSPELFSSASSVPRALIKTSQSHTPSQLLFDSRCISSPELFDSSSKKSDERPSNNSLKTTPGNITQDSVSGPESFQTPALSLRVRQQLPRRKLVEDHELDCRTSTPSGNNDLNVYRSFSPDLF